MNPLMLAVMMGHKDSELLNILSEMDGIAKVSRLSPGEQVLYAEVWHRLDAITRPE